LGQLEKAVAEFHEVLRLQPNNVVGLGNLAAAYVVTNRFAEARETLDQVTALVPDSWYPHLVLYYLAFAEGDTAGMEQQVAWAADKPGAGEWLLDAQADTEAYAGRLGKARDSSRQAVASARRANSQERAALWRVIAALREAELGQAERARKDAIAALALGPSRNIKTLAALALARAGDEERAQPLAQELERDFPLDTILNAYWLPTVRATLEINRGNPGRAIEILQAAAPYDLAAVNRQRLSGGLYPVYVRGQAYMHGGQGTEAVAEFQKMLDHRGLVLNSPLGALARLNLARSCALAGDTTRSRRAYLDFLTLWKDADPDIPILQEAQAEYAKLQESGASLPAN
jgi:tetratricopeptide (TPR) repeat protein